MAQIRLVRDLGVGDFSLLQLLKNYIFGDKPVEEYSSSNVYNEGDLILYRKDDGTTVVLKSLEDDVTGPFDETKWDEKSISETISNISLDKLCMISLVQPDDKSNIVWLYPIDKYEVSNLPTASQAIMEEFGKDIDFTKFTVLFSEDFPVAEDEEVEDDTDIKLYFDPEGEGASIDSVEETFADSYKYKVDEQEDILVAGEAPAKFSIGQLLFDTDLSNEKE